MSSTDNKPYHFYREFENAVVWCSLTSPDFMQRIGHYVDPDLLAQDHAKLLMRAAHIVYETTGRGLTSPAIAIQRLTSLCADGKLSYQHRDTATQWVESFRTDPDSSINIEALVDELTPILKQRLDHSATLEMCNGHNKKVMALLQAADAIGKPGAGLALEHLTVDMADADPVHWLWPHRIAVGVSHVVFGAGGAGKSSAMRNVAALIAMGAPMPGEETGSEPRSVIIIGHEDSKQQITADLVDAGADQTTLNRIHTHQSPIRLPEQVPDLERLINEHHATLVIIERFTMKGSDAKTEFVRPVMDPLSDLAERTGCAIVTIKHTNKGGDTTRNALSGSTAWEDASRHVLYVTPHPDNDDVRVMVVSKTNLGPRGPLIGWRRIPDLSFDPDAPAPAEGKEPRIHYRMEWDTSLPDISANDLRRMERSHSPWNDSGSKGKRDGGRATFTIGVQSLLRSAPMPKEQIRSRLQQDFGFKPSVYQMDTTLKTIASPFKDKDGRTLWRLSDMPPSMEPAL